LTNPSVSATGIAVPWAAASSVVETAIVESTVWTR
jgi:hypothetical protein